MLARISCDDLAQISGGQNRESRDCQFPRQRPALKLICQGNDYQFAIGAMSVAFTRASVKGEKGQKDISRVSIDPSVFFVTLPSEILFEVGASSEFLKARLELEDGSIVEAAIFSVIVSAHGRENVTLAATYDGALPVLGARFLEDFGLRVDLESGLLELTRHQGFAYGLER